MTYNTASILGQYARELLAEGIDESTIRHLIVQAGMTLHRDGITVRPPEEKPCEGCVATQKALRALQELFAAVTREDGAK